MPDQVVTFNKDDDRRPIPDPTVLTTQQLLREIGSVRELLESRINAMDTAVRLLQSNMDRTPTVAQMYSEYTEKFRGVQQQFEESRLLQDEKFSSIQTQFRERDTRTEQTSKDSKVAVDAALQAAKEAVGEQNKSSALAIAKSEASTTKQIDQISVIIATGQKGTDEKIDDVKTRMTSIEGQKAGSVNVWGYVVGALGVIATIVMAILMVVKP